MRKVIFWILFILTIAFFVFDACFAFWGIVEVDREEDRIEEMGGSGVDHLGTGADVFIMIIAQLSNESVIFSGISAILTKKRLLKITSLVLCFLFVSVPFFSYVFYLSIA